MKKTEFIGLIPAAGEGTRMYPFSRAVPKEMYPILGKPVIEHCIDNLREGGIKQIFMIVGHQKGALMDYVGDGSFYGVNVAYIYQLKRKGLGHAILQAEEWIKKPFVTLLGDSFIEPKKEIQNLMKLHTEKRPIATVLLFKVNTPVGYGIAKFKSVENNSGPIEKLVEKPSLKEAEEFKINDEYYALCGAYAFESRIFDFIRRTRPGKKREIQITDSIQLALEEGERVYGVILNGKYLDIGKWHTVFKTEKRMLDTIDIDDVIKEREEMTDRVIKTLE
ncbi:MAG: sugar phosphate nucleotidyltransferase [Candidatus Aenigmarchaeota archaeon]|nr:sugar phosphate nucleotidyltransferase [Candidatus Aenigmarchaeota archaeon]